MKKRALLLLLVLSLPLASAIEIKEIFTIQKENALTSELGTTTYYYAGSKLIASKDSSGEIKYQYQNRLGSDTEGKQLPFGQEIVDSSNRFEFTGKELDSNLYYFGARYYDPEIGRFTSVDPVKTQPPYQYVANNPMNLVDPNGMEIKFNLDFDFQQDLAQRRISEINSFLGEEVFSLGSKGVMSILNKKYRGGTDEQNSLFKLFKTAIKSGDVVQVEYWPQIFSKLRGNQFISNGGKIDRFDEVGGRRYHEIELSHDLSMGYSANLGEGGKLIKFTPFLTFVHEMAHFVYRNQGESPAVRAENLVRDTKRVYYYTSLLFKGDGIIEWGWTPEIFDESCSGISIGFGKLDVIGYFPSHFESNRVKDNHPVPYY